MKKRKGPKLKGPRKAEFLLRRRLREMVSWMNEKIQERIVPVLERTEGDYVQQDELPPEIFDVTPLKELWDEELNVRDGYAGQLREAFTALSNDFQRLDIIMQDISAEFVREADQDQRDRFYKAMSRSLGVDVNAIAKSENLEDVLIARTQENVRLIKSIPDQYLKNVEVIVYEGTVRGRRARSMITELTEEYGITYRRARTIARDQTSKLNSVLNEKRQTNLGIEEYDWITAHDGDRVRESHRKKHGKRFRWDSPPADTGHPGEDVNCRCYARAVIPG